MKGVFAYSIILNVGRILVPGLHSEGFGSPAQWHLTFRCWWNYYFPWVTVEKSSWIIGMVWYLSHVMVCQIFFFSVFFSVDVCQSTLVWDVLKWGTDQWGGCANWVICDYDTSVQTLGMKLSAIESAKVTKYQCKEMLAFVLNIQMVCLGYI